MGFFPKVDVFAKELNIGLSGQFIHTEFPVLGHQCIHWQAQGQTSKGPTDQKRSSFHDFYRFR
jgi:hypothetical protein